MPPIKRNPKQASLFSTLDEGVPLAPLPEDVSLDLPAGWQPELSNEISAPYMKQLLSYLVERSQHAVIYPAAHDWLHALEMTPLSAVKVVMIGQDPYHQPNQAHGLCFSVKPDIKVPPSLVNIYKELSTDLGIESAAHGFLESWAKQGVLMINSVLTVEDSTPNAHKDKGWERFTDKIIEIVNRECTNVVFLLWGSYAQKKGASIDRSRHCVLEAPHPSPLSAHRGFFGSRPFSQANAYLTLHSITPIQWQLPDL